MSTYSAFFSSGLLAPPHLYPKGTSTPPSSPGLIPMTPGFITPSPGPTFGSSPTPIADDSDVEDLDISMEDGAGRDHTPTPSSIGGRSRSGSITSNVHQQQQGLAPRPRLRKRRSSLTVGTSPFNSIKSSQRNAGNALHLQQRLPAPTGPIGRSRSGSLNLLGLGAPPTVESRIQNANSNIASEGTSLIGRIRSGSSSTLGNLFKPRRNVRRLASVPAPTAPPPTAPLPAIPKETLTHQKSYSLFHNTSIFPNPRNIFNQVANRQPLGQHTGVNQESQAPYFKAKGRDRAFSCTAGVNIDTRIDEEMK